jgi:hypothetical protein
MRWASGWARGWASVVLVGTAPHFELRRVGILGNSCRSTIALSTEVETSRTGRGRRPHLCVVEIAAGVAGFAVKQLVQPGQIAAGEIREG